MSIGTNIKSLREERKLTQEQVAESLGITFQAVSSWERDEYKPDIAKLIRLAELFDVSVSAIAEEKRKTFKTKETIYNWEHMKTYVKATARNFNLKDTLTAVDYAVEAHEGQKRKKSVIPYIYHPLNLSCHALSMGLIDDEIIAACGSPKVLNVAMTGALAASGAMDLSLGDMEEALRIRMKPKLLEMNLKALHMGAQCAAER